MHIIYINISLAKKKKKKKAKGKFSLAVTQLNTVHKYDGRWQSILTDYRRYISRRTR